MSLGIVVPAYHPPVDALSVYVRALVERVDPEVVRIELDAADPSTVAALRDLATDEGLPVVVNAVDARRGKGAAVTAGFEGLRRGDGPKADEVDEDADREVNPEPDVYAFVDADGATPADSVAEVVDPVLTDEAELAVGSRRHPESQVAGHQGYLRRYLGDAFAWLARRVVGSVGRRGGPHSNAKLYDYQCGAKAISADAWNQVRGHLHQPGFAWDLELVAVAAALGCRIREVPISWEDQPGSTVSPVRDTFGMFAGLLAARHRAGVAGESRVHRKLSRAVARVPSRRRRPLVDLVAGGESRRTPEGPRPEDAG